MAHRLSRIGDAFSLATKTLAMRFGGFGGQGVGYGGNGYGWMWPFLPGSKYDYVREAGQLWLNSIVSSTIGWKQRNFVEARPYVYSYDEDGDTQTTIPRHGLVQLLKRPNPYYTGMQLWYATLLSYDCSGNAFWVKGRAERGFGQPMQLWWVPHWMMTPQWAADGTEYVDHYLYSVEGQQIKVRREDVVHFRCGIDPLNPRMGLSPLASCLREICADNEINNYTASLMRNMGVPGLIVTPKTDQTVIPFGEEENLKEYFNAYFTGDMRGSPMVHTIPLDVQMPGFNPDQMAIEVMRKLPEERISAALGIPASVVGLGAGLDNSSFNNLKELRQAAYENCIIPMHCALGATIDQDLLPDFEPDRQDNAEIHLGWSYKHVRVLQEDENKKAERLNTLFQGDLLKRSEGRAELGYESKKGVDDVYFSEVDMKTQVEVAKNSPRPVVGGGGDSAGGGGK